jgi:hypothetical protein
MTLNQTTLTILRRIPSKTTLTKLTRMLELTCIVNDCKRRKEPQMPTSVEKEYGDLLPQMANLFLPLVSLLVRAGLIKLSIPDAEGKNPAVTFEAESTWLDKNIWIEAPGGSVPK